MIHTVLITRPQPAADELAAELTRRGYQPVISPILEIVESDAALPDQQGFDALLMTSPTAVRIYAARTQQRDLPVYAVGGAGGFCGWRGFFHVLSNRVVAAGGPGGGQPDP